MGGRFNAPQNPKPKTLNPNMLQPDEKQGPRAERKFGSCGSWRLPGVQQGFRGWGLGFGVWGLGFGVWGLGFRV